jgi:hypothetical protein
MSPELNMQVYQYASGIWVARVAAAWHTSNFQNADNNNKTVTFWDICYSASGSPSVKEAAGGRWRIGYQYPTDAGECYDTNHRFLRRMNGLDGNAQKRTAGEAWTAGGFTANTKMQGNQWTTLCPSPMLNTSQAGTYHVWPPDQSAVGQRFGWGCIIFDTYMNDSKAANEALIDVSGLPTYDHRWARGDPWREKYMLGFTFDNSKDSEDTTTHVRAVATQCANKDADGGRALDGNRVTPNEDDRDWEYTTR